MSTTTSVSSSFASTSRENSQDGIRCKLCGIVLTDETFYQNHLKSKKHRVNLKVARRAIHEKSQIEQTSVITDEEAEEDDVLSQIENPLETVEFSALSDYKTKRETYRPRDEKNFEDHYNLYKNSLIAYWSINLSFNPTVQDFKISAGDKKWENFGDVVVDIEFKDLPGRGAHTIRCAIQFKQIASHNMKILQPFEKGPTSYEAIARQIEKINNKSIIVDDTRFITFSTSLVDPTLIASMPVNFCDICRKITISCKCLPNNESSKTINLTARTRSIRQNVILNTSEDNDTVFSFICTQGKYDLPKIYVYSCQKKAREFPIVIEEIMSDCFGENRPNIAKDFIKFIEIWSNGQCGGYYKLRKEDVLVRLGQILLGKFRVTPELMTIEDPVSRFSTWIQALKIIDITLLKPTTNLAPLIEPFNLIIQKTFKKTINTTNETISFKRMKSNDEVKHLIDPILRGHVYEETKKDLENTIPLERVYLMFWKAGLMPLMLEVTNKLDQDYVFRVINELKSVGLTRRYLIKTNQNTLQLNVFKFLDFFINLGNISKKLGPNILANVTIRLTNELRLSLAAIEEWDVLFKNTVTPEEFFHMALGNYSFRPYNGVKEEHTNSKLVLEKNLMEILKKEVESTNHLATNNEIWLRGVNPDWFS
ncbi:unnamed protein product [Ceutorhynchus assimilis]|uniref:C2H2-type domain-containing protein n=1 Tax=Ceutorhynchus assimilis TaxID=467358 RepID=A0A9N9MVS9_9CUCU|nr:unnamed protein product [Ceutorhynchus assimilis]